MGIEKVNPIILIALLTAIVSFGLAYGIGTDFLFGFEEVVQGIAVDSTHIFVVNSFTHTIQIFDLSGNFVDKFGSKGSGDGEFKFPESIAVNSKNIFVADTDNHRIQIFDLSGNFVDKFGSEGSGDGQFNFPRGIAVDDTHIVVADTNNHRIQIFNSAGVFQSKFGSLGSDDGQFSSQAIALDSSGNIYVADSSNNRIQIFNSAGVFLSKFGSRGSGDGLFSFPLAVAVDSSGNIYVADLFNDYIQIFNSAGVFQSKLGSSGSGDGQFESLDDVAIDSTRIYVAGNDWVQVFGSSSMEGSGVGPVPTEITSYLQTCEGLLSVDEVKTVIGYTDELAVEFFFNKLPQPPKIKGGCLFSFGLSSPLTHVLTVRVGVNDPAFPIDEDFNEKLNKIKASSSEFSQGESETGWKFFSAIINEGEMESQILSFKDRYGLKIYTLKGPDIVPLADLSQLHEIAKIVWEKIDKKIITVSEPVKEIVPSWIKNNAKWWSEGQIGDSDFVSGIQFMIKEKIINIPDLPEQSSETAEEKVPDWIRNNAGWWADELITEDDFVSGIKYLVEQGIIGV